MTQFRSGYTPVAGLALGFVVGATGVARDADAHAVYAPAGACNWAETWNYGVTDTGAVENRGVSGTDQRFSCDLATPGHFSSETTDDVIVYYRDNNNGSGMDYAVTCNVVTCSVGDTTCYQEQTRFSCSTVGGCTTVPGAYTGSGALSFSDINRPLLYKTAVWCYVPVDTGTPSAVYSIWYSY